MLAVLVVPPPATFTTNRWPGARTTEAVKLPLAHGALSTDTQVPGAESTCTSTAVPLVQLST